MTSIFKKSVLILVMLLLIAPMQIQAQAGGSAPGGGVGGSNDKSFTLQNPLKVDSVAGLVQNFIEIFSYIVILFAVLALIYVGFRFILARGNAEELNKMKGWLFYIVIGVAVVIGARVIIQIVVNTLAASGTVDERTIRSVQDAVNGN